MKQPRKSLHWAPLMVVLTVSLAACGQSTFTSFDSTTSTAKLQQLAVSKAPSRLRRSDGSAKVTTFATYYAVPDQATLERLDKRDISFVQPSVSADQMRSLQTTGYAVVYLAIGELAADNLYVDGGVTKRGSEIVSAHQNDTPKWFVGNNGNFGARLLNLTNPAVQTFIANNATALLGRGFDGLFLDTADDAEFFSNADANGPTSQAYTEGAVTLDAGRPTYPTMRRAYIDIIKKLRETVGAKLLIQNGGFDLLLDRQNSNDGSQGYVDGVMHEVAITKSNKPSPTADDTVWPFNPQNYETWEQYYARISSADANRDRAYRANRDTLALEYFRSGGVVFQQDFGHPDNHRVQCASYVYARDLRNREKKDGRLSAYSDAGFQKLYDYVDATPAIRAEGPECSTYDQVAEPDFSSTFRPSSVNVGAGRSGVTAMAIGAVNGYNGNVTLSLGTLPSGITASLSQTQVVPGPQTQVTVTMTSAATLAAGTYIVPIKARSQGQTMVYDVRLTVWKTTGDSVFVAHAGSSKVLVYDNSASLTSSSSPARSLPDYSLPQASGVALDTDGSQYVIGNVAAGQLTRYPSYSLNSGAATVVASNLSFPTALAVDAQHRVWVAQSGFNSSTNTANKTPRISRFDSGATAESGGFDFVFRDASGATVNEGLPTRVAVSGTTLWIMTSYGLLTKFDINGTPTLQGVYSFPNTLNDPGSGGLYAQNNDLWISGNQAGAGRVVKVNTTALPAGNSVYAVAADAAVTKTLTNGLYDPAGLGLDSAGNLWVINKTDAAGIGNSSATPGALLRFPVSSLTAASPTSNLKIASGSRCPLRLAIARP